MIALTARLVVWLGLGITIGLALYWTFLTTPESNLAVLALSGLLAIALVVVSGVTVNGAVLATRRGALTRATLGDALRGMPSFVLALVPAAVLWWVAAGAAAWAEAHAGEISAWFIATFGWADVTWLFPASAWALAWVRWIVGPVLSLSLLAALLGHGASGLAPARWCAPVWHWRVLGLATTWALLLVALPWQAAVWRPIGVPPTWIEPALAAARLAAVALVMTVGLVLVIRAAVTRPAPAPAVDA